jgi:hypothetical protein
VIKDDFTNFVERIVCQTADHITVVNALIDWFKRFGIVYMHVADQGSHFKNLVVDELCSRLHIAHHFVMAYTPWANGTVEIVNRHVFRCLKALCSEFNFGFNDNWPFITPLVNMALNHQIRTGINYAPITILTGLKPSSLLSTVFLPHLDKIVEVPMTSSRIQELTNDFSLDVIHRDVSLALNKQREANRRTRKKRREVQPIKFTVGVYVLVALNISRSPNKTVCSWIGPAQIVDTVNDHVFKVKF